MLKTLSQLLLAGLTFYLFLIFVIYITLLVFLIFTFSISFCDLAMSEYFENTMSHGSPIIERKNINNTLFVLNECFSVLRYVPIPWLSTDNHDLYIYIIHCYYIKIYIDVLSNK